ncbi:MAG: nucleotidyltransferase family protein [Micavibrio sp.]|nr:nucleotidyltransferase family protein [Micavibrio sp.]
MSRSKPDEAFILAAGLGTRMRPLTDHIPKPMVVVAGEPLVDHITHDLRDVDVKRCVVNTHYKAEVLRDHLAKVLEPEIIISHEPTLLDTGGGLKNALHHFNNDFYIISGDSFWLDNEKGKMLSDLAAQWDAQKMDILIALQAVDRMTLTRGVGDYDLDEQGRAVRSMDKSGAYMFTSVRINSKAIFDNTPPVGEAFSYLALLDRAQEQGRLYGMVYEGDWHHISTPEDLTAVNQSLQNG